MSTLTQASYAQRHVTVANDFTKLCAGVSDWSGPTPVPEWQAREIVTHLSWLPGMLSGWGVTLEVPTKEDPVEQFEAQTQAVADLLNSPAAKEEIDTQFMGVLPLEVAIDRFYTFDVFAHSWDLAKASGQAFTLDTDFAQGALEGMRAMGPALHASGQFGTPQPVAKDAPAGDQLMALIGRDPNWPPA